MWATSEFHRTGEVGSRDEGDGVMANTLNLQRNGAGLLANAFGVGYRFVRAFDTRLSMAVR